MTAGTDAARIAQLHMKVQQLAHKVHRAKADLDWHRYNWAGLADPQIRAASQGNWQLFPNSPIKLEIERKARVYREARSEYMQTKAEYDAVVRNRNASNAVTSTRAGMQSKIAPHLRGKVSLDQADVPKLMQVVKECVDESVRQMRADPSVPNVLVVVETLAAGDSLGFDSERAGDKQRAFEAALKTALELRDKLQRELNPSIPNQKRRLVEAEILVQYLGG